MTTGVLQYRRTGTRPSLQMQLMRETYRLGEYQPWEAMLPSTKQRLREASQAASLGREDSQAFW